MILPAPARIASRRSSMGDGAVYRLPELHELIKNECPPAYPSLRAAYKEIIPALLKQRKDPSWFVARPLPSSTTPRLPMAPRAAVPAA